MGKLLGLFRSLWAGTPEYLKLPIRVAIRTWKLYGRDDCANYAAAIAYYALFSLVPLALILLTVFGLAVDRDKIVDFVFDQLPLEESTDVRQRVVDLVDRSRELSGAGISLSLLVLFWSSSGLFGAVRKGLNATTTDLASRPFWHGKLVDLALVVSLGTLITTSVGVTAVTRVAIERAVEVGSFELDPGPAYQLAYYGVSAAVSFVMFLLMYRSVPTRHPAWDRAVAGALFATVTFEALKYVGALLLASGPFSDDAAVYAGISVVFIFLFWVWLNASILLMGSEFGRAVAEQRQAHREAARAAVAASLPRAPSPGEEAAAAIPRRRS